MTANRARITTVFIGLALVAVQIAAMAWCRTVVTATRHTPAMAESPASVIIVSTLQSRAPVDQIRVEMRNRTIAATPSTTRMLARRLRSGSDSGKLHRFH